MSDFKPVTRRHWLLVPSAWLRYILKTFGYFFNKVNKVTKTVWSRIIYSMKPSWIMMKDILMTAFCYVTFLGILTTFAQCLLKKNVIHQEHCKRFNHSMKKNSIATKVEHLTVYARHRTFCFILLLCIYSKALGLQTRS